MDRLHHAAAALGKHDRARTAHGLPDVDACVRPGQFVRVSVVSVTKAPAKASQQGGGGKGKGNKGKKGKGGNKGKGGKKGERAKAAGGGGSRIVLSTRARLLNGGADARAALGTRGAGVCGT